MSIEPGSAVFVPVSEALGRFDPRVRPTLKHLRTDMLRRGCAIHYGRYVVTRREWIERYLEALENERCPKQVYVPSSSPSDTVAIGSRAAGFRSVRKTVPLPEDEFFIYLND